MDDPDAMSLAGKIWVHWILFDIPTDVNELPAMKDGKIDIGKSGQNSNYKENYDIDPHINVCNITPQDIKGTVDIICGGFPCQPFSNGGKKRTFSDKRGLLFDEIMRLAQLTKPKFMFLENVKHILKVNDGQVIQYIESEINNNGYVLQRFEMSPHLYGIPQQRERIYFVCVRNDIYNDIPISLPPQTTDTIDLSNFLDKEDTIDEKYKIKGDLLNVLYAWDEMIQVFEVGETLSPALLIHDAFRSYCLLYTSDAADE